MTAVIETGELGKRYRRLWALADCTLSVPAGHVVGLSPSAPTASISCWPAFMRWTSTSAPRRLSATSPC